MGYPKVVGRVGALAVFLGVGTAISLPGVAQADDDGSSSSSTSDGSSSASSHQLSRPGTSASKTQGPAKSTGKSSRTSAVSGIYIPSSPSGSSGLATKKSSTLDALDSHENAGDVDVTSDFKFEPRKLSGGGSNTPFGEGYKPSGLRPQAALDTAMDTSIGTSATVRTSDLRASSATVSKPETTVAALAAAPALSADVVPTSIPVAPKDATAVTSVTDTKSPLVDVVTALLAPWAGAGDPGAPGQSPAEWALLAFARRQAQDAAVPTAETTTALQVAQQELTNQVSPLGTPEQLNAEKIAMQTANTLPVQLMKLILQQQFQLAAQQQFASVGGPDAENLALLDHAVSQFALFSAFTQQLINPMDPALVWADVPAHSWFGMDVGDSRYLYDNPDTIYRFVGVNKNASYVITGRFDNYDPNDPEGTLPADTTFSVVEGTAGTTSSILTGDQLEISPDGTFVITVSGDPAAPGEKNHIQLTSNSTVLLARNTLGDWNTEEPMSLSIAKVAGPPNSLFAQLGGFTFLGGQINDNPLLVSLLSSIPPSPIAETPLVRGTLTAIILMVRGANEEAKYIGLATHDPVTGEPKPANFIPQPTSNAEFLANQRQSIGNFALADDEALVLTIDPGSAGYSIVPVYNDWTTTVDFWNQQTSLNNEQVRLNANGTYTVVIAPTDPGVYNWVSTGGLNQGIIAVRFQDVDEADPDSPRIVRQDVVPISQVAGFFPDDPRYFVTEAQRAEQLALRKAGYNQRFAPYPQA